MTKLDIASLPPKERRQHLPPAAGISEAAELIGGHHGLDVFRDGGGVFHVAYTKKAGDAIKNAVRIMALLPDGLAPEVLGAGGSWLWEKAAAGENLKARLDAGESAVDDGEEFRRQCVRFLYELRQARIRHGDLTPPNLFVQRTGEVMAVDWQESHLFDEPPPAHQLSDSFLLWRSAAQVPATVHPTPDTPRLVRRWMAVQADLGGNTGVSNLQGLRLLDLGCFMGDLAMMARADGMEVTAADADADALLRGRATWQRIFGGPLPEGLFVLRDAVGMTTREFEAYDAIVLFSTWPYIVRDYGRARAERVLQEIAASGRPLYFECQLLGDGPGPDFLTTDEDILQFLSQFGAVRSVSDPIGVTGREAARTIWRVQA